MKRRGEKNITVNKLKHCGKIYWKKIKSQFDKKKYHQHVNRSLLHFTNTKYIQTAFFRYHLSRNEKERNMTNEVERRNMK